MFSLGIGILADKLKSRKKELTKLDKELIKKEQQLTSIFNNIDGTIWSIDILLIK